ncbi:MAG: TetR/AcrR family transcriptional regulator [Candidatus Pristimantibacillus lignocellulolyticus]|uniref:TetR/AcrR family transcriptional regulator n=1 Tax=Candidatus Pristimantibacillus lignocellulolyticus TaxID=2994561 RepID=A0A9J6ZBX6_9BACL|nr:MAG: TetR/AcrR family transcriptional regulator [Candidatus Pristimantibacillus lignocellulolyticus]
MNKDLQRSPGRPKQAENDLPIQDIILRTAAKLFMEHGYEPVSLQQIAKACNVTKPSIYYHFTSKPELFKIAVTTMFKNVQQATSRLLREADHLEAGLLNVAKVRLANPHSDIETILRDAERYLSEIQIQEIREAENKIYEELANYFEAAMDKNILRRNNSMLLAQIFSTMMVIGNKGDIIRKSDPTLDLSKEIVGLFLRGTLVK